MSGNDEMAEMEDLFAPVAVELADAVAAPPPGDLRERVLTDARARRAPGPSSIPTEELTPVEAFGRTVDAMRALLLELDLDDWEAPAHPEHGRVRDVVAHLVGVEQLALGWLGVEPHADPVAAVDHVRGTADVIVALGELPPDELVARWYAAALRITELAAEADQEHVMQVHDLPANAGGMLVLRTFEVWSHAEDVARATGRSVPGLDGARARLMSQRLMDVLPFAFAMQGSEVAGATARLVLTGPGGGTYNVALAATGSAGAPDVTVVADVVDLCRLAARRATADELELVVEGDRSLAPRVLTAVGAFSRD